MTKLEQLRASLPLLGQINEKSHVQILHEGEWIPADYAVIFKHLHEERFNPSNWRVKPDAPKVVPWTFETAPQLPIEIVSKDKSLREVVVAVCRHGAWVGATTTVRGYDHLLSEYTLADGSPCGIPQKEESEWPKWRTKDGDFWRCDGPGGPIAYLYKDEEKWREVKSTAKTWEGICEDTDHISREEIPALIAAQKEAK